jgi:hypothetical protein
MQWGRNRSAAGAPVAVFPILSLLCALAVAGCNTVAQQQPATFAVTRGATVAFDSIDGPPREVFDRLVQDLNAEARDRRLAVTSRDGNSAYRVRGYLGAQSAPKQSTVSWVWDVYDRDQHRVLRITGEEKIAGSRKDAWQALDEAATRRIAHSGMEQLAAFLASSPDAPQTVSAIAYGSDASPEAAGIVRISTATVDPVPMEAGQAVPASPQQRAASTDYQVPSEPPRGTN